MGGSSASAVPTGWRGWGRWGVGPYEAKPTGWLLRPHNSNRKVEQISLGVRLTSRN